MPFFSSVDTSVIVCKMLGKINVSLSFLWLVDLGNFGYLFRFIQDFSLRQLLLRWTLLGHSLSVIIKRHPPNRESKKRVEKQGLGVSPHDDFVAVKMCHSPNPTPLGFMHMQVYCFPVSCDIFGSRAVIRPERTPNCACVTKFMHP